MGYNIALAAGILLLIFSFISLSRILAFLKTSERAVATVIDLKKESDSDGTTYRALFRFQTRSGQEILRYQNGSNYPANWKIGEETTIAYKASDPSDSKVLTYFGTFSTPVILMMLAMPLFVIGAGYHLARPFLQ